MSCNDPGLSRHCAEVARANDVAHDEANAAEEILECLLRRERQSDASYAEPGEQRRQVHTRVPEQQRDRHKDNEDVEQAAAKRKYRHLAGLVNRCEPCDSHVNGDAVRLHHQPHYARDSQKE